MNPMQRVNMAMSHAEPDQVPLLILATMHGARDLGLSIREYYSRAEHVVEGQLRLRDKFRSDCLNPALYAAVEVEAFGGETVFIEDGPPNAGAPVLRSEEDIDRLQVPNLADCSGLQRGLEAIRQLKARVGDEIPILGSVVSPFSLPIMQMGFEHYLDFLYGSRDRFAGLMAVNQAFCVAWANAQLEAGATAIGYADPLASTTLLPRELYLKTGHRIALDTLPRIKGPVAIHLGSGRGLSLADDLAATGTVAVGVSALEDLGHWKVAARKRFALIGNLNGVEMRRWSAADAEREVKRAISKAGHGGGFILADNHGEIPWQVPDEVLFAIRDATDRWGRYPLTWKE
ncbi:MAG TPA: uroporphyrinogen decarboxylase family protein [Geothrix sp.]|nr:uroporphyrinogen decarboxylase family protein [Geothrix sp.]